jgi:hypothetical protein
LLPEVPPAPDVAVDPVEGLQNQQGSAGIQAQTTRPGWQGERFDVAYAIDVMHPLARR